MMKEPIIILVGFTHYLFDSVDGLDVWLELCVLNFFVFAAHQKDLKNVTAHLNFFYHFCSEELI